MADDIVKQPIEMNGKGIVLRSIDDMHRYATCIVRSGLAPRGLDTPEKVIVCLQTGAELGLPYQVSLRSVGVINGCPILYGDAPLGLVRRSGFLEAFSETIEGDIGIDLTKTPNNVKAVCIVKRKGEPEVRSEFSVGDARRAKLWGKQGPWTSHPQRMLKYKARVVLRDVFPDVLMGIYLDGELEPEAKRVTSTVVPRSAMILNEATDGTEGNDGSAVQERQEGEGQPAEYEGTLPDPGADIRDSGLDEDKLQGQQVSLNEVPGAETISGSGSEPGSVSRGFSTGSDTFLIPEPDPAIVDPKILAAERTADEKFGGHDDPLTKAIRAKRGQRS